MMMVLRTQSLGLLEASCKLEAMLQEAVEKRRRYWWPTRQQPSPATSAEPPSDVEAGVSKAEVDSGDTLMQVTHCAAEEAFFHSHLLLVVITGPGGICLGRT